MFGFFKKIRYAVRSPKWQAVRKEHIKNNPNCIACGRNKKVEAHHIEPVHVWPEKELNPSNLVTLCDDPCHLIFGHLMNYKSWNEYIINDSKEYLDRIQNRP